ncbi:cell wall metabolism sensor histidine kinase WalK [Conexibacter sp. SYSU D00693]|uniref:sensor histidine kinase n=1 Tax=Conexibacter sp. SYSU D00693 TaxID=2812560 RepID=UPI00196B5A4D|nr:HAMP domain-containing sensor histidine kinase [Conexibacter sp. SYSU D00693]
MLAVVALGVPLASTLSDRVDTEVRSEARGQADLVAASAAELLGASRRAQLQDLVERAALSVRGRVLVVGPDGRLLADSQREPVGRVYGTRPEVAAALGGRAEQLERVSDTLDEGLLATAVPVVRQGSPAGAVRITQSTDAVDRAVRRQWLGLGLIGLVVVGLGLGVGWVLAGGVARPVRRLDAAARRVADGDLSARAEVEGSAEQQSLARTFNLMTERLERLVASQRRFVADASHQLRTPLAGLRLRIEAAEADAREPEVRDELQAAQRELDRLAQMVGELLELSRAGERDLPGEEVDLDDAAARAAERWERAAQERGQRVVAELESDGRRAWCARVDVDRIVDALVENALHYSPSQTAVRVVSRPGGIDVLDDGPGITPEEAEAVFERFHRGSAGRRGPSGTGLGLPIARELASRWGGDVMLVGRREGGTAARLRLPARAFAGASPSDAYAPS